MELPRATRHMMRSIMAKHSEDYLDLSTGELRVYLKQRNHTDLATRALVAFEQNLPIKKTADTRLTVLCEMKRNETKRNGTLRNGTLRNGTLRNGTLRNGTLRIYC